MPRPLIHISSRDFAEHIANIVGRNKRTWNFEITAIEEALIRFEAYVTEKVVSGYLTDETRSLWLRENEWSGL
jgi:hypothetical protein